MTVAIFDLDETLLDGQCTSLWASHMADLGWVDRDSFVGREQALMAGYRNGTQSLQDYLAFSLAPLVGRTAEEIAFVVEPFVEDVIEPLLHSAAMRCLATHRSTGVRVLLIGTLPAFLVEGIAARLGIADALGIELEERHGCYSGQPLHADAHAALVTAVNSWLEETGEILDHAYVYCAAQDTLWLLDQAAHPHAVNPAPELQEQAEQHGWPILEWR